MAVNTNGDIFFIWSIGYAVCHYYLFIYWSYVNSWTNFCRCRLFSFILFLHPLYSFFQFYPFFLLLKGLFSERSIWRMSFAYHLVCTIRSSISIRNQDFFASHSRVSWTWGVWTAKWTWKFKCNNAMCSKIVLFTIT